MLVRSRTPTPATESQRATDVSATLERRAAMSNPPGSIAVPPAAAVAIAGLFHRPTPSARRWTAFTSPARPTARSSSRAARVEQGYASPEGYAALYCLIVWVNSRLHAGGHAGVS